ncbi:quinone oxidoreductase-like protein 1 [Oscarella lobularis]|uniref:quinone oxidoreductase-like protein 1 n=1 Tax=Oscarella lobularis TaxID=121494 RepID=UPI0033139980
MKSVCLKREADGTYKPAYTELPPLQPHRGHVIVEVKACGLSPVDVKVLSSLHDGAETLPVGYEVAGVVKDVGQEVTSLQVGDSVIGLLSLASSCSGCAEECEMSELAVVPKPESVGFIVAAGSLQPALWAYTAVHYLGNVTAGNTVLICDGATANGTVAIQLAQLWGAKVIATASNHEEAEYLEKMKPPPACIINLSKTRSFVENCLAETGGLGADCIIDQGVDLFQSGERYSEIVLTALSHEVGTVTGERRRITKHDAISALAVGGKWITSMSQLQLDPPDSQFLSMKSASVSFVFEHAWMLSARQHGKYMHILEDLADKLNKDILKPMIHHTVSLLDACSELSTLSSHLTGKVVMKI